MVSKRKSRSLYIDLTFIIVFLIFFLLVSLIVLYSNSFISNYRKNIETQTAAAVQAVNILVKDYLSDAIFNLHGPAEYSKSLDIPVNESLSDYFKVVWDQHDAIKYYQAINNEGNINVMYPLKEELIGTDASGKIYFIEGRKTAGSFFSSSVLSSEANEPVITITYPYSGGLLVAQLSLLPMLDSISTINALSAGSFGVLDKNGVYILHSDTDLVSQRVISPFFKHINNEEIRSSDLAEIDGVNYFYSATALKELDGTILFYQSYEELQSDMQKGILRFVFIVIVFGLISIAIAYFSGRIIFRPFVKIQEGITLIASGDYSVKFDPVPYEEINKLLFSVNDMAGKIYSREANLETAKTKAEDANRVKDRFIANMSHELRTPLNGIAGLASLLGKSMSGDEDREKLRLIINSVNMITRVVSDILDYSLIEQRKLELSEENFSLRTLTSDVIQLIKFRSDDKSLDLTMSFNIDDDLILSGDKVRVSQILTNLLINAIKFTEHGRVDCCVNSAGRKGSIVEIEFIISDTGIGIPQKDLQRIFERFTQLDDSTTKSAEGIGLGLSITNDLVKLMDGRIKVESTEGEGSCFTVVLPFMIAEKPEKAIAVREIKFDGSEYSILVVEDEAINRLYLTQLLSGMNFNVIEACDGKEGIQIAIDEMPQLILMDISMPVMDGWDAAAKIRENNKTYNPVIFALTAHTEKEVRAKCKSMGMNGLLTKPLNEENLKDMIHRGLKADESDWIESRFD